MSKRILSLMLSFVMVFSMLVVVPATAATYEATDIKVIPDKTTAAPGDTINYSIVMGPVSDLGSLQMELVIPEGLTYVTGSGATVVTKEELGFDAFDWTDDTLVLNGGASEADYASDSDTTLMTFQCTVNDGYTGTTTLDLTYLEFYSCETWDDHTERFSVVTTPVTVSAGSGEGGSEPEAPLADYEIRVTADKEEVVVGDTVNFTITMGPVENLGSLQMELVIPEGLTYVTGSGATVVTKEELGFDAYDWTDDTLVLNGGASEADYASDEPTELMTFQCTVNDNFSGTATLDLTYLEFYSCETWDDHTALYSVTPAVLKSPAGVETPFSDYELRITADKTDALPGDIINFTVAMGPVENLGSMQMQLVIPNGLTYVPASGAIPDGLMEAMGFDALEWTEESLVINGGASAADYASTSKTVLATFQCQADANFSGTATVDLTYLEFYSCQSWTDYTDLYSVTPAVIQGPEPTTSTLTFVTEGSAVAAVEDIEPGTTIDLSTYTTTKDGYRFMGWYTEAAYENIVTEVTVDADTTVYAKFLKEYTLTYYVDEAVNEEVVGVDGQVITLKAVPAKSGYDVLGWFVDNAGEAVTTVTLNSDVNVYAQYEYIPIQYTVTFMVDGTEYGTFKVGEGRTLVLANAIENPTKEGYRFDGWELDGTIVTEVYGDGDKTVEAQFVKQYTLTYTAEGFATETETVDVDTVIDLSTNIPEKEYYIFTGWTLEGAPVTSVTMDADKEVIASYVEAVAIVDDVEFATLDEAVAALADGSEMKLYKDITTDETIVVDEDAIINLDGNKVTSSAAEAFEITGDATIKNGAIDADGIAVSVEAAAVVSIEDVDIEAATAINMAAAGEITVDADSTIATSEAALALNAAGKVALNAPVTGKVIGAYNKDAEITTTNEDVADAIDAEGYIVESGNVLGIARTLTFVTGDGTTVDPIRTVDGTVFNFTGYNLEREGYTFAGWYAEEERVTPVISLTLTEDTTLYAKFTTTLSFDTKGGDPIGDVIWTKGATADLSHYVPTYGSYEFVGWYADTYYSTPADAMLVMNTHKTIYAKWKAAEGQYDANKAYMIEAEARPNPDNGGVDDGNGGKTPVFNAGETIYVDYTISSTEINTLGSFQFEIEYDDSLLDFVTFEGALTSADGVLHTDNTKKRVSFDVDGNKPALDITGGKIVVTAVFTAKADVSGEALVGIAEATETNGVVCEVTPQGYDKNVGFINLVDDTVLIKNILVTFKSGDNAAFVPTDDDITTKVNYNVAGFIEVGFDVPADKLEPADDFRLCADTTAEPLWYWVEEDVYKTSAQIQEIQFTDDVATFIAQVVATGDITIVADDNGTPDDPSDDKGTVEAKKDIVDETTGAITFTVDAGTTLTNDELFKYIEAVPNPGYVFDMFNPTDHVVSGDTTITVLFKDAEYVITNNIDASVAGVDITAGIVTDPDIIRHGTDVVFTVTPVDEDVNHIVEVGYTIDGVQTAITPDAATGEYTIPGDAIIGNVGIYALVEGTHLVTFSAYENGTVAADAAYYVNDGEALTAADIADAKTWITPDPGYKFVYFAIGGSRVTEAELTTMAIYSSLTVDVIFDDETYNLTREDGTTIVEVTHGDDYTFVPELPGKIITNITGEYSDGTPVDVKKNTDGSYTIDGDDIIDDIKLNPEYIDGTIRFILNSQYRAIYGGHEKDGERKIAVLETAQLADGQKYMIADGDFHWSSRYNAYVHVVPGLTEYEGTTAAMIVSQLVQIADTDTDGDGEWDAYDVDYSGDMNMDGKITSADPKIITDMLHQQRLVRTSERHVLMADVTDATPDAIERVTTADVDFVRMAGYNR